LIGIDPEACDVHSLTNVYIQQKETKIANMAKLLIYILTPSTPSQLRFLSLHHQLVITKNPMANAQWWHM
jgi:hypothetical protein